MQRVWQKPDKEFKGSLNVRIDQELHREAAFAADRMGITLNQYVIKRHRFTKPMAFNILSFCIYYNKFGQEHRAASPVFFPSRA